MRTWVEKLARKIEREGIYRKGDVKLDNIRVCLSPFYNVCPESKGLYAEITDKECLEIKIYEDEYDLLKNTIDELKDKAEKKFIDLFESFNSEENSEIDQF